MKNPGKVMKAKKTVEVSITGSEDFGSNTNVWVYSLFTDFDISLFVTGKHFRLYEKMGAHLVSAGQTTGVYFAVWAPNAQSVNVTGSFNNWNNQSHQLNKRWYASGIWEGFIPGVIKGDIYKYSIKGFDGSEYEKGDPFAIRCEEPPKTASMVWDTQYQWADKSWLTKRQKWETLDKPMSVYEVHLGSWQRDPSDPDRILTYREIANTLVPYVVEMGFTHVELMPIMEYPYYPSWGYQVTNYFAATSRHGTGQELMYLIESLHKENIGVILDWVPSHFPGDQNGLYHFDGTHLYEHADMRKGFHPDWKSYIFNYDRNEVRSFLISSALFWIEKYHVDGLRVDAVASMLYFSFSRSVEESATNEFGGPENLGAIQFLQDLNEAIYSNFKGVHTIAEESTTYPGVTHPVKEGGLGFGMKWMMGWMNDTLKYFKNDPINRKYHHHQLTFSITYAFTEKFMLPFSHDEVVHGKSPMIYKMPGDEWQKFANLRALYAYMFTQPGTKLLFMGNEFANTNEWNFAESLNWNLLNFAPHAGMKKLVKDLNSLYKSEPALYIQSFSYYGFQWINADDEDNSVYIYTRHSRKEKETLLIVLNLTPVYRDHYRLGLPFKAKWKEIFNTDSEEYFGSGKRNEGLLVPEAIPYNVREFSTVIALPPLAAVVFKQTK